MNDAPGVDPARSSSFRGATVRFAPGALAPALANLAGAALFTRLFSTAEYGAFALALVVSVTVVAVATQWLQQAVLRFVPATAGARQLSDLRHAIALGALGITTVLAAACAIAFVPLASTIDPPVRSLLAPALLFIAAGALYQSLRSVLQAELRSAAHSGFQAGVAALGFAIAAAAAVATGDAASLLWGPALATLLLLPLLWRVVALPAPAALLKNLPSARATLRPLGSYGWPMVGWFAATSTFDLTSRAVIQVLRGPAEVGIYSASYTLIVGGAGLVILPLNLALHPLLMRAFAQGDAASAADLMRRLSNAVLASGVILVGWTALVAPYVATVLLGEPFREGFVIMPVVLAGVLLWQLGMVAHKPLEWAGRTRLMLVFGVAFAGLNLALNYIAIARFGYTAAPWATAVCYAGYTSCAAIAGRRFMPWAPDLRYGAGAVLCGAAGFAVAHRLAAGDVLLPGIVAGCIVALVTTLLVLLPSAPWARTAALPWRPLFRPRAATG